MADDGSLIELEGVRFAHPGSEPLFDGLDLSVRHGEQVGLVGANGSGKTTLFHLVMGLLRPEAGTISVLGRPVTAADDHAFVRQHLGFLFQQADDQLFCPTVEDDVAFGPLNLGSTEEQARGIVRDTLRELDLAGYERRITDRLSGGEKRLVALATVLAMKPVGLLLDEPASGLDPRGRSRLVAVLARIGGTQLVSSHNMEFVRATCRRAVVLDGGRVVADGPTDAILGDADLMLHCGLEVPYSLEVHPERAHDHHHGAGPSHGHGHDAAHTVRQHDANV